MAGCPGPRTQNGARQQDCEGLPGNRNGCEPEWDPYLRTCRGEQGETHYESYGGDTLVDPLQGQDLA